MLSTLHKINNFYGNPLTKSVPVFNSFSRALPLNPCKKPYNSIHILYFVHVFVILIKNKFLFDHIWFSHCR